MAAHSDSLSQAKLGGHPEVCAYQVIEDDETVVINLEFHGAHWVSVKGMKTPPAHTSAPEAAL